MGHVDNLIADRLGGKGFGTGGTIYKFERIKRAKARAAERNPSLRLIDMGVGEDDFTADPLVIGALREEAGKSENRRYADNGIPEFRQCAARYMARVFGVAALDPERHILHGIGSKSLLAMIPACFINPGDVLLTAVPCYPVASSWTRFLGGAVYALPLREENGFLPDFGAIPPDILNRAKLLYLNYPNNPTGAVASPDFFARVVDFARRNGVFVVHDAAYAALTYGETKPLSFLSAPGAMDVGVEVHSLSKAFSMTGWRMGFVCGNEKAVAACASVKDNTDAGQFRAIQKAAIAALDHPELTSRTVARYARRFDLLVPALRSLGLAAARPGGSFYCYVRAPTGTRSGIRFADAAEAADYILENALVSTVPWDDAGPYLRFSVTFDGPTPEAERATVDEMVRRLKGLGLTFDAR